jgi:peptidyl-prolyl cis-trans isomerase A (cyclophilin A)
VRETFAYERLDRLISVPYKKESTTGHTREENMYGKIINIVTICLFLCGMAVSAESAPKNPVVLMETSMGNIKIELFRKDAPITVKNFLSYVKEGFYSGTIFHRVIPGFMIQGGGFTPGLKMKPTGQSIRNEAANGLKNDRGTIAMARTAAPDSASSQFFINVVNNDSLNRPLPDGHGYAVFGRVIEGMNVVDRIAAVKTGMRMSFQDVPQTPVQFNSVKISK